MTADRLYPMRPFLAASIAVVRDGRVLLAARGRPPLQGVFTLPGGLVEPGEALAEAALRELGEEVGVQARIVGSVRPVEAVERDGAGRVEHHSVIVPHAARWVAGEGRLSDEATAIRWVRPDEIAGLSTTRDLDRVVRDAFALLGEGPR